MTQLCDALRFQEAETPSASDEAADEAYRSAENVQQAYYSILRKISALSVKLARDEMKQIGIGWSDYHMKNVKAGDAPETNLEGFIYESIMDAFELPEQPEDAAQAAAEPIDWN